MSKPDKPEQLTFEQSMDRLDRIVRDLESGQAPLAQSLALFEEGAGLIRACTAMLDEAEQKVLMLQKSPDGKPAIVPFEE